MKKNYELSFQTELFKKLYKGEKVLRLFVSNKNNKNEIFYGDGIVFRSCNKPLIDKLISQDSTITINLVDGYFAAKISGDLNIGTEKRKKMITCLESENNLAYVCTKYLNYFEEDSNFFIADEYSVILVSGGGGETIKGLIFPYIVKK